MSEHGTKFIIRTIYCFNDKIKKAMHLLQFAIALVPIYNCLALFTAGIPTNVLFGGQSFKTTAFAPIFV